MQGIVTDIQLRLLAADKVRSLALEYKDLDIISPTKEDMDRWSEMAHSI